MSPHQHMLFSFLKKIFVVAIVMGVRRYLTVV